MAKTEVCRIVYGQDEKRHRAPWNAWWEARMTTKQGEIVIKRVTYFDKYFARDSTLLGVIYNIHFSNGIKGFQESVDLKKSMNFSLVPELIQDGWTIVSTDGHGQVTIMKRSVE
jgi:hypothetical protein